MHDIQQLSARVRRTPKPIGYFAVSEIRVHLARVDGAASANECQYGSRLLRTRRGPHRARGAWMHQLVMLPRQVSIVDEEVLFQRQFRIAPLQVARPIPRHAMAQSQVLSAGWGADGICLHESKLVYCTLKGGRLEQRARDRIASQMVQCQRHAGMIFQTDSAASSRGSRYGSRVKA